MVEEYQEVTIIELLGKAKLTYSYIISKWKIIVPIILIGGLLGYLYAYFQKPKYEGTLTFVLSVESKMSGLGGLASQFGIDLGSTGSSDVFAGDNIITLFRSRKMISRVLFKKAPEDNELLINIITRELKLDKKWSKKDHLKGLFPFPDNGKLNPTQDSLVSEIYNKINEEILTVSRTDKKLSVYEVKTNSTNEIFSTYLTRYLVDETARFYIDTKTSISKQNLAMLQKEADSIRNLLGTKISSTASEVDRTFNLNPALQVQRASIQKGQINVTVLSTAYGEVVKNLEIAKISLQKETPLYQIIDIPTIPLKAIKVSKLLSALVGIFLSFFIIIIILLIKRKTSAIKENHTNIA